MYPILKRFSCSLPLRLARVAVALTLALVGLLPAQAAPLQADPVWQIQIVASTGAVGTHTSLDMSLDSRGYPVISYYDATNGDLKLVQCGSPDCSTGNTIQTLDSAGDVGLTPSLLLDSNDNPIISYLDLTNRNLKLIRCSRPDCSGASSLQLVDGGGMVGLYNSLVLDSRGYPIISYFDNINRDLKLVRCGSPDCATGNAIQTVDSEDMVGLYPSLVLDSSGNPLISYFDNSYFALKLARQEATTIGRCAGYDAHHQGCSARNWSGGRPLRWL